MTAVPERLAAALADRYRLEREVGAGGMATVYLAEDLKHKRRVAVKVLKPELAAVLGAERFVVEITTTAALQHPHILPLFDSGEADGFLYYVMPFIDGETLRTKLDRETQLGVDEAVRIASDVASALHYAHTHGVIHRDIKPENILLHDGRPMVADFGIALAVSAAAGGRMTETGLSLGTPHYMSPEQATAEKEISARSDVYSLGSMLYEMLTGNPPHTGASAQQIIMKIITTPAELVTVHRKSVPANVAAAVAKSLEKLPADRFESAKAFAEALANPAYAATLATASATASAQASRRPWWRDPRNLAIAVAGMAIGAGVARVRIQPATGRAPVIYDVGLPDTAGMLKTSPDVGFALSLAGDFVVYETVQRGRSELWYRSLLDATVRRIPGSEGGSQPVISPDGRRIAFFRSAPGGWSVEVMPVEGGTATTIARGTGVLRKLMWPSADRILTIRTDGREARWLDPERGPVSSFRIRYCEGQIVFDDDDAMLCGGGGNKWGYRIALGDTTVERPFWHAEDSTRVFGTSFRAIDGRYLTYVSIAGDLFAAPVDLESGRVGRAVRMANGLGLAAFTGTASYSVAATGTLVYALGENRLVGQLVRLREGGIDTLPVGREAFLTFAPSPDGRRLAAVVEGLDGMELRIYDLASGRFQTWIRRPVLMNPVWSPRGDRILFGGLDSLFVGSPDRAEAGEFLRYEPGGFEALSWLPDDRVFGLRFTSSAMLVLRMDRRPVTVDSVLAEVGYSFPSADGRWIAYANADYSEAWVEPLPRDGRRFLAAAGNIEDIQWLSPSALAVPITDGARTRIERVSVVGGADPRVRNEGPWADATGFRDTNGPSFAAAHGGGLLYMRGSAERPAAYLRVVPNWVAQMKKVVDEANR